MPRCEKVGAIIQPLNSGSGANDGLDFIHCVGRRQLQIQEVWTFGNSGITPKVHPFVRVDVSAFTRDCFGTDYLAENGRRVPMFVLKYIKGSVEWLSVLNFL